MNLRRLKYFVKIVDVGSVTLASEVLHIAQPENAEPWFEAATKAGVVDYDIIGLSYYSKWSKRSMAQLGQTINRLRNTYAADVLVVETAYPFTTDNADSSPNLLGEDSLIAGYPATPAGQPRREARLSGKGIPVLRAGEPVWRRKSASPSLAKKGFSPPLRSRPPAS